jgi:hypothetical protein
VRKTANLLSTIRDIEKTAVPSVKYGEGSPYPDYDFYQFLALLVERRSTMPIDIKKRYLEFLLLDEDLNAPSAEDSDRPESWQLVRDFAQLNPPVAI